MSDWMKKELDKIINKAPREWTPEDAGEERRADLDELIKNHHPKFFNEKAVAPMPKKLRKLEKLVINLDKPLPRNDNPLPFAGRQLVLQAMEQMNLKALSSFGSERDEAERHYAVIRKVYEKYSYD